MTRRVVKQLINEKKIFLPSKYEAKFHIEKVPFTPFGTLHSQELQLEVQNDSFGFGNKLNTIQIMAYEFDDSGNNSSFIIGNLLN